LGGRKGIPPVKTEWWGDGMGVCLEQGADLHMIFLSSLWGDYGSSGWYADP